MNNYEAEASVLGSILLEPELLFECILQPKEFEDDRHKLIMEYILYLSSNDKPIDTVVMAEHSGSKLSKIGGISYLTELQSFVPTTKNFNHYQQIVREEYIKRHNSLAFDVLNSKSKGEYDINDFLSTAQKSIDDIYELMETKKEGVKKLSEFLHDHQEVLIKRKTSKGITGAKTASADLDKMTGGHQKGDIEILAARPSMGKTAYMINDAVQTAESGRTAVIFSIEMPADKIAERTLCTVGNIEISKMKSGNFDEEDWERWAYAKRHIDSLPILIDDTPGMTLEYITSTCKKLVKENPEIVVYVDYLQLVRVNKKFNATHERVSHVSGGLKYIARACDCPVVAISAVGRTCEARQDKRPMLSDLRDSGSIESDADIVIFLYRDEYYNPESEKKAIVEIILAKGRDVGVGTVEMVFYKKTGRFLNIDRRHQEEGAAVEKNRNG